MMIEEMRGKGRVTGGVSAEESGVGEWVASSQWWQLARVSLRCVTAMLCLLAERVFESVCVSAGGAGERVGSVAVAAAAPLLAALTALSQRSRPLLTGRLFRAACWSVPTTRSEEKHRTQ